MYDRIWTGFDLWRSLLAVSPDKADRTSDFFFGKTAGKGGGKNTEKTECGRVNSVAPGDCDQYRDSMSDAVGGREDPSGCFVSSGMLLVLPDPGGTFTFCGE